MPASPAPLAKGAGCCSLLSKSGKEELVAFSVAFVAEVVDEAEAYSRSQLAWSAIRRLPMIPFVISIHVCAR